MNKILYLECFSGISGDMTVGALLDLGIEKEKLIKVLDSLKLPGFHIETKRSKKCGIDTYSFDVILEDEAEGHNQEDLEHMEHSHSHVLKGQSNDEYDDDHDHDHDEQHHHEHEHHDRDHDEHYHHDHNEQHHHDHDEHNHNHDEHAHTHSHVHRNIKDIEVFLDRLEDPRVKQLADKMFQIVAKAESKAHGIPIEEVHFHEVGAVDSIVDIVSTAYLVTELGVDDIVVSRLHEGQGQIRCAHGILPVPVPATLNIVNEYGLNMKITDTQGEMITPTGAAIAAALRTKNQLPENYRIEKIGIGSGKKDFEHANILRAMILSTESEDGISSPEEKIWLLETNLDDCSGEALAFTMEALFEAGARDVFYAPIYMKKNRPACMLRVICDKEKIEAMEDCIFANTTTIGIRKYPVERTILDRKIESIETPYGAATIKICTTRTGIHYYPEYESIRSLCKENKIDYQTMYHEVMECAMKKENN